MKPTLETIAVAISLISFLGGLSAWYSAAVVKKYAAQRDFEHLQRSYQQLAQNLAAIEKEIDSRLDKVDLTLADVKAIGMAILAKTGNENSMGWQRTKGRDYE